MMSGGQFERLIREGQILAFEPDLFVRAELVFQYLSSYLIKRCLSLFSSLCCHLLSETRLERPLSDRAPRGL